MLSYLPQVFIPLLMLTAVAVVIVAFVFGLIKVVRSVVKGTMAQKIYSILSMVCVLVMAASWFFNFGWLRFIFTFIPLPVVHVIAWFFIVNGAIAHVHKSKRLNVYIILSYITFLGAYFLLPDGGDIGPMYVFFGLIRNDVVASICGTLQPLVLLANIVFLILTLALSIKLKNRKTEEAIVINEEEER